LKIPPQVPLVEGRGRRGGSAVGRTGEQGACPCGRGSCGRCDSSPGAVAAAEVRAATLSPGGTAAGVTPSGLQGRDWRGGRAGASTSEDSELRRPGFGRGGWPGGRSGRCAATAAQRRERSAVQFVQRVSFTRSVKEAGPAISGHGKGPPSASAGTAGLTGLREGRQPVKGRDTGPLTAARRSAQRPGAAQRGHARPHQPSCGDAHSKPARHQPSNNEDPSSHSARQPGARCSSHRL
jgi:hypothetical protein